MAIVQPNQNQFDIR